jgi:hypothetical protein
MLCSTLVERGYDGKPIDYFLGMVLTASCGSAQDKDRGFRFRSDEVRATKSQRRIND